MVKVRGELYGQEEDPFEKVPENEVEDSFAKVSQVTTQNSVQEIRHGTVRGR